MTDDPASADSEYQAIDSDTLCRGLMLIRRRRWYLWTTFMVMPLLAGYKTVSEVIILWYVVMLSVAFYAALARCPRCGNYFHVHGPTLLYLRKCLHCQLHVIADKRI